MSGRTLHLPRGTTPHRRAEPDVAGVQPRPTSPTSPRQLHDAADSAAQLRLSRWRYALRSHGLHWSGFPGALLHSGLGMMLARHAPEVFASFIGGEDPPSVAEATRPKPWWMLPPLDSRMVYAPGDDLVTDLYFANPQRGWEQICAEALQALGEVGMGSARCRFSVVRYELVHWDASTPQPSDGITLSQMFSSLTRAESPKHIGLQLITPLRVKSEGGLLRSAPVATVLVKRVLARAAMLAGVRVSDLPGAVEAQHEAASLILSEQDLYWDDLSRYSARQQAEVPMGGLTGWLRYKATADVRMAWAWLAIGEWLHVGTKTTFGLGAYRILPTRHVHHAFRACPQATPSSN